MPLMPGSEGVEGRVAALLEQQNILEALQVREPAIGEDPENGRLYELLGQGLAQLGRSREALDAYNAACYLLEDPSRCLTLMGTLHTKLGEYEEAVAAFRTALSIQPQARVLLASIAYARFREGKLEEAEVLGRQAVAEAPDHRDPHYVLGMILAARGNLEAEIAAYRLALAIDPEHVISRAFLGQALLLHGEIDRTAWGHYHQRLRLEGYRQPPRPFRGLPEWDGGPIPGRLLLWEDQGIGDRLFSLRFVALIG
jgi:tetratricopeptide (TPR) repeat protein